MSLLVHYTLKSSDDDAHQVSAMKALVADLQSEGVGSVNYSCFKTDDPTKFVGLLEFDDDDGKKAFLNSDAFDAYKKAVGPTFANPPQTTEIAQISSTRG